MHTETDSGTGLARQCFSDELTLLLLFYLSTCSVVNGTVGNVSVQWQQVRNIAVLACQAVECSCGCLCILMHVKVRLPMRRWSATLPAPLSQGSRGIGPLLAGLCP